MSDDWTPTAKQLEWLNADQPFQFTPSEELEIWCNLNIASREIFWRRLEPEWSRVPR